MKQVGEFVRQVRVDRGLTQDAFCDQMQMRGFGTTAPVISRIEAGKFLIGMERLEVIAKMGGRTIPKDIVEGYKLVEAKSYTPEHRHNLKTRRTYMTFDDDTVKKIDAVGKALGSLIFGNSVRHCLRSAAKLDKLPKFDLKPVKKPNRHHIVLEDVDDKAIAKIQKASKIVDANEVVRYAVNVAYAGVAG